MRPRGRPLGALALAAGLLASGWGPAARAQNSAPPKEAFSAAEVAVAATVAASGVFLLAAGKTVFSPPSPSMGAPAPDSLDARLSRRLYRPGEGRFLWSTTDVLGIYLVPVLPALAYGYGWLGGKDPVAAHRLLAYVQVAGWTFLGTGVVKYLVGRPRPYTEATNNHPELRKKPSEDNLSFFSGHASSCFAVAAFATQDLSRYLQSTSLASGGPVARWLWGSLFPYAVGYGVPTLVAVSRIIDQQHWPSDVLVGGLMGALIGRLGYSMHFDPEGRPRGGTPVRALPLVTPLFNRDSQGGRLAQVALVGRF
jgi:membrane-associated phospholipid phosphatase